ncbi:ribosomal protein L7/L12, partial [Oenococcus oeni]
PSVIKKDLNESDANDLKSKLEAAGATVTLK